MVVISDPQGCVRIRLLLLIPEVIIDTGVEVVTRGAKDVVPSEEGTEEGRSPDLILDCFLKK